MRLFFKISSITDNVKSAYLGRKKSLEKCGSYVIIKENITLFRNLKKAVLPMQKWIASLPMRN
jgi:predicted house-cleaning NTP pyrophosphatase (Maf/HAM1 superfamily)